MKLHKTRHFKFLSSFVYKMNKQKCLLSQIFPSKQINEVKFVIIIIWSLCFATYFFYSMEQQKISELDYPNKMIFETLLLWDRVYNVILLFLIVRKSL